MNRSKVWAAALLVAVFVAGAAAGWLLASNADRGRRSRGTEAMVAYLDDQLNLTSNQRDSVRTVFQRRREATRALWREVRPRFDSLRAVMTAEIAALLDSERRARYLHLVAEKEEARRRRREAADSGKRK